MKVLAAPQAKTEKKAEKKTEQKAKEIGKEGQEDPCLDVTLCPGSFSAAPCYPMWQVSQQSQPVSCFNADGLENPTAVFDIIVTRPIPAFGVNPINLCFTLNYTFTNNTGQTIPLANVLMILDRLVSRFQHLPDLVRAITPSSHKAHSPPANQYVASSLLVLMLQQLVVKERLPHPSLYATLARQIQQQY